MKTLAFVVVVLACGCAPANMHAVLRANPPDTGDDVVRVITKRIERAGGSVKSSKVTPDGVDILARLPSPDALNGLLRAGRLELAPVDDDAMGHGPVPPPELDAHDPPELCGDEAALVAYGAAHPVVDDRWLLRRVPNAPTRPCLLLVKRAAIDNTMLDDARVADNQATGYVVNMLFTSAGAAALAELTRANLNHRIAIVIDGEIVAAPVVMEAITGGHAMLTPGGVGAPAARLAESTALAASLAGGALKAPITLVSLGAP